MGRASGVLFSPPCTAGVVQPTQATTTHGRTLDYALCSRTVAGLVKATVLWDVPFRPHAAVLYEFDIGGLDTPVLQGPNFDKSCLEHPRDLPRPANPPQVTFLLEPVSTHPRDTAWGGLVRWLENTICADGEQGRGWNVEADIKPLVAPSSPAYPWFGKQHSFWGRMQLWVSQAAEGKLDSKIIPVVLRHLQQEAHDVELEGIDVTALRAQLADNIRNSQQPPPTLAEAVNKIQQQAARQHQARQSSDYQQWLEAATSGGMQGLYTRPSASPRPPRFGPTGTFPWNSDRTPGVLPG